MIDEGVTEATVAAPTEPAAAEPTAPRAPAQSSGEALERALATLNAREEAEAAAAKPTAEPTVERDEAGRFRSREAKEPASGDANTQQAAPVTSKGDDEVEPPARFTPEAKAAWKAAPPEIRAEVRRALTELESGLGRYQEVFAPLKPHAERFREHNLRLDQALEMYAATERQLATEPAVAIRTLAQRFGFDLQEVAYALLDEQPAPQATAEVSALKAEVAQLRAYLQTQATQQTRSTLEQQVAAFQASAPRFAELEGDIAFFLTSGRVPADLPPQERLRQAYDLAARLNPGAPQPQARPQTPPPQSISGAPSMASNAAARTPSSSIDEALRRAMAQVGL